MAITIREEQDLGFISADTTTFTLGPGTLTADKLVLLHANDYQMASALLTPAGSAAATWALQTTVDGGADACHIKVWTADVTTAGAQTVVANWGSASDEHYAAVFVLSGAASGTDGAAGTAAGASSTSHVAPSVTPVSGNADDLLICLFINAGSITNYTMPVGMTAYAEQDVSTWATFRAASQQLASAAATGTRTATATAAQGYQTVSVLIKADAAVPPPPLSPTNRARLTRASCW